MNPALIEPTITDPAKQVQTSLRSLEHIKFVKPKWLARALHYFPWFLLVYVFVQYFFINRFFTPYLTGRFPDNIHLSGFILTGAALLFLQTLLNKSSTLLNDLWLRGVFQEESKTQLIKFGHRIEYLANHRWGQVAVVLVIGVMIATTTAYTCYTTDPGQMIFCNLDEGPVWTAKELIEFFTAMLLAPLIWRMLVAARSISQLGRKFDFNIIWNHPDQSGGLLPIGVVCFWLAAVMTIPATFLGGWMIICQTSPSYCQFYNISQRLNVFEQTLFMVIILTLVSFVWPLWSTHTNMTRMKADIERKELSLISQQIDFISKKLIENTEKITWLNEEEIEKVLAENKLLTDKLSMLQNTYIQLDKLPVWPFDKNTIIKLVSSQGIPLLGLTGVGANILNLLKSLLSLDGGP